MKKTIQWKQTYLLTYLFGWNRLQIILCFSAQIISVLFSRTDISFWNALPAAGFSAVSLRKSTQEAANTNYRETQTQHFTSEHPALLSSMLSSLGATQRCLLLINPGEGGGFLYFYRTLCISAPLAMSHWNVTMPSFALSRSPPVFKS